MAAVWTLSAGTSQGRFYLRHRRVLLPRHHARSGHADYRDGRDEWLPQGIAGQDSRTQRAPSGTTAGIAAHRLEGCGRTHQPGRGVRLAAPVVDGQGLGSSPFNAAGVFIRGIRADDLNNLTSIAKNIKQGSLDGFDEGQGVAIGRRLADQLSLHAGDSITLVSPKGAVTPMGTTPRIKPYKIAAVFEIGMSEYDSTFVFMPLTEAQAYFNRNNDVSAIEVFTTNPDRIDAFRKAVTEAAGRPVFLVDWRQRNSTFFNALQVERNVMFLILTMIVLVAALNIVSGLIMLVKDKGSDIAILRTMGASQGSIMRVFLITGAAIGVVGTLTGFFVGLVICLNIESIRQFLSWLTSTELFSPELYFLSKLPADIDFGETSAVVIMALTLSFLATLYPSWRAARLDPIEALRYE